MNRINTVLGAALLASSMIGGVAVAADQVAQAEKSDKTQVVPSREALDPSPPTVEKMDANVQRQHDADRDGGSTQKSGSAGGGQVAAAGGGETRDWSKIDTNNDNLIQPAEMEEALKATGPQADQKR